MAFKIKKNIICIILFLRIINLSPINFYEYNIDSFKLNPLRQNSILLEDAIYYLLKKNNPKIEVNYLAIPWKKLIYEKKIDNFKISEKINRGFTVCQHWNFKSIIPKLKKIGIDVLFTPHATKEEEINGIKIIPLAHYAINIGSNNINKDIFYSYIGSSSNPIREKIFAIPKEKKIYLKKRKGWHFHLSKEEQEKNKKEYIEILSRSRFVLCPRGNGSTLRFWESLASKAIPVLIDDATKLPEEFDWSECVVFVSEKEILNIPQILKSITKDKEEKMREKCIEAFCKFSNENLISPIINYYKINLEKNIS